MPIRKIGNLDFEDLGTQYVFSGPDPYNSSMEKEATALTAFVRLATMLCANSSYLAGTPLKESLRDGVKQTSLVDISPSYRASGVWKGKLARATIKFKDPKAKALFDKWMQSVLNGEVTYVEPAFAHMFDEMRPMMAHATPARSVATPSPVTVAKPAPVVEKPTTPTPAPKPAPVMSALPAQSKPTPVVVKPATPTPSKATPVKAAPTPPPQSKPAPPTHHWTQDVLQRAAQRDAQAKAPPAPTAPSTSAPASRDPFSVSDDRKKIVFNDIEIPANAADLEKLKLEIYTRVRRAIPNVIIVVAVVNGKLSISPMDPKVRFSEQDISALSNYKPPRLN